MFLGCLLGQYNTAQSFELVNSWFTSTGNFIVSSVATATDVHSSSIGRTLTLNSGQNDAFNYDYKQLNDFGARASTAVNTHYVSAFVWTRQNQDKNIFSSVSWLDASTTMISSATSLQRYTVDAWVSSADNIRLLFRTDYTANSASFANLTVSVDDVAATVDGITLHADRNYSQERTIDAAITHSIVGEISRYQWNEYARFTLPVRYLPVSEALLINEWWNKRYNLLFIPDSSDSSQQYIVRIVNSARPFAQIQQPYYDLMQGTIQLQAITYEGVF